MKLKLLLFLFLAPFLVNAARTNQFDIVLINTNILMRASSEIKMSDGGSFLFFVGLNDWQIRYPSSARVLMNASGQIFEDTVAHQLIMNTPIRSLIDPGGNIIFDWNNVNQLFLGFNSSTIENHVGISHIYPNGFNYNSGVLTLPVSLTGVTSNNVPMVIGGTGGISTISSGTNLVLNLNINSGAGILNTQARYTSSTNSSSGPVVMNLVYTNNTIQRLRVTTGVVMPTAVASQSTVEFWSMGGGETNRSIIMTYAGVSGAATQTFGGTVQPTDLFMWTNTVSTPGASTLNNAYTRAVYE